MSPVNVLTSLDVPAGHAEEREQVTEAVHQRMEQRDGLEDTLGLRAEEEVGVKSAVEHGPPGTRMGPNHPGYLEHVPSQAYSPTDLAEGPSPTLHYQTETSPPRPPAPVPHPHSHPMPRPRLRRKSTVNLTGKVAEAVFFNYGVSVFFGFSEDEERDVMEDCDGAGVWMRGQQMDDWEVEEFHYTVSGSSGSTLW